MGQPKKRTTPRRTGMRRSHHLRKLARRVNATSPVKVTFKRHPRAGGDPAPGRSRGQA